MLFFETIEDLRSLFLLTTIMLSPNVRLAGRPRRQVDLDQVISLRKAGLSLRQISSKMLLGYGTIRRALLDAGAAAGLSQNPNAGIKNC
uniref:Resolvase HTH domain-containing protein n=1 Tax=Solibacter usitatus (strain Ellin6076) TaxID=234267 RepID=Q01T08_SOLUE